MSLRQRIFIPMIALTIGCSVAVLISSILLFNRELNDSMYDKINVSAMVAQHGIENLKANARIAALGMASNPGLLEALASKDSDKIASMANALTLIAQLDFCTILDGRGVVLTRTHAPDMHGDSLAHLPHVKQALAGNSTTYVTPGVAIRLGAYAGAPIFDNTMNIVGIVSVGYRLDTQKFVRNLKELTGCEITVFLNDERVSSTLLNEDGVYPLGTKAETSISEKVLAGESHVGKMGLFGRDMLVKYVPLYGADQAIGMVCIGYFFEQETKKILFFIVRGALITLALLAACLMLARFIAGVVERRLENMMDAIREADERAQLLLDATPMSCTLWNDENKIVNCNQEVLRLFGIQDKEDFYEKFYDLSPEFQPCGGKSKELSVALHKKTFDEGFVRTEWMHQFLNGEHLPCEVTFVRVKYREGHLVAAYARDLREYKANMVEINNAQEMLRQAVDAAKAASQAKSAFLANMSHEIRTPMNSIIGFSELAQDGEMPFKSRDYLEKITENAKWLLYIINDILDLSKIESGKMSLEHIPFSLHEAFTYCQALIAPKAAEKGLSLFCYAEPSLGKTLLGDPVRLRQVFVNILSNAVKFTNVGTVKFMASIAAMREDKATIRFEIRDSGIGMSPEQIERIYQPFMQGDESVTRRYGGTGLGLAITKNIIDMMGGKLAVVSEPGLGSKFSFELTFDVINTPADMPTHKIVLNDLEKPNFEGEVLVCEDNDMNQQVICEHLARVGLQTVVANNGKEGVDIVRKRVQSGKKPFDLIFMDIHMPVMDGLEAASKIAELGAGTPIVALTANVMVNEVELYRTSGMFDFVSKPFTSQELWKCLLKYFLPVGISVVDKGSQAADDAKLLRQLKMNFFRSNQTLYADIRNAVNNGDIKLGHRLAHTLKSNAGQIGETQLQKAAAALEDMFKSGQHALAEARMELLEAELKSVLEKLTPLLAENGATEKDPPICGEKLPALLEQLEFMLKNRNPECMNMLDDIRSIPGTEELVQQIEDFEFRKAATALAALKEKVGTG